MDRFSCAALYVGTVTMWTLDLTTSALSRFALTGFATMLCALHSGMVDGGGEFRNLQILVLVRSIWLLTALARQPCPVHTLSVLAMSVPLHMPLWLSLSANSIIPGLLKLVFSSPQESSRMAQVKLSVEPRSLAAYMANHDDRTLGH